MQMSESVALLRALKEINRGTGRIATLLSEALSREIKSSKEPGKSSSRLKLMGKSKTKTWAPFDLLGAAT
jgi:hypothetical protein